MEEREEEGIRNIFRLQTEGASQRHKAKTGAKSNWFKKNKESGGQSGQSGQSGKSGRKGAGYPRMNSYRGGRKVRDEREVEGVTFVPYTTGGKLRSILQKRDDEMTKVNKMGRKRFEENPGTAVKWRRIHGSGWQGGAPEATAQSASGAMGRGSSAPRSW